MKQVFGQEVVVQNDEFLKCVREEELEEDMQIGRDLSV